MKTMFFFVKKRRRNATKLICKKTFSVKKHIRIFLKQTKKILKTYDPI